jgi:hypothetical protein
MRPNHVASMGHLPPNGERNISGISRDSEMRNNSGFSSCRPGLDRGVCRGSCNVPQRGNHSARRSLAGLYIAAGYMISQSMAKVCYSEALIKRFCLFCRLMRIKPLGKAIRVQADVGLWVANAHCDSALLCRNSAAVPPLARVDAK